MKSIAIEKAFEILSASADKYQAERYAYVVTEGTDSDKLQEHGSMEEYCEKCITNAVADKKKEYIHERTMFMGKIYEVSKKGYAIEAHYRFKNGVGVTGTIKAKVFDTRKAGVTKEVAVKRLEKRLRKEFPEGKIFSSQCYDTNGSQKEGFEHCASCGKIFDYSLLLTEQELEHWEEHTKEELMDRIKEPSVAYELREVLYHWHPGKFSERIEALAIRLIR